MQLIKDFQLSVVLHAAVEAQYIIPYGPMANVGRIVRRVSGPIDVRRPVAISISMPFDALTGVTNSFTAPYDALNLIIAAHSIPVESSGLKGQTAFMSGGTHVHFRMAPLRASYKLLAITQPSGRDTTGAFYAYTKSLKRRVMHTLKFITDKAIIDDLLAFHATTVKGNKIAFIWSDHNDNSHTVNFAATEIPWKRLGPDRFETTVQLREDFYL